ncbi:MAG: glycosyltransferase [Pseudomonadota bacterium]
MHSHSSTHSDAPQLSVIMCTFNPRSDHLSLALHAIGLQSLCSSRFEVIVVDNNSSPPLDQNNLQCLCRVPVELIRQPRQGLTHARTAGIQKAQANLLVFVDDDNELASDYLENAIAIARQNPTVGLFGGQTDGVLERPVGRIKAQFLPQLGVRNHGSDRIEGPGDHWGEWEPIGAGMVVRAAVAQQFVSFVVAKATAGRLGRNGNALMSGEDSLFSRLGHELGYTCAYEPELKLKHHIAASRLTLRYLARLSYGHGRSHAVLNRLLGKAVETDIPDRRAVLLFRNFVFRCKEEGIVRALGMYFWDLGYLDEVTTG